MDDRDSAIIQFRDATYRLPDGRAIVADLNFDVRRSETLVLLGRSGSGKTTTLKLINALLKPTSGVVLVEGVPTTDWEPTRLRRRIGYVIQEVGLFPHFTVANNVGLVPTLEKWDAARRAARVEEMLRLVDLEPSQFAARTPAQLSGGQKQRVGVARALAADPPILLLDEPFGSLDPLTRVEMQKELRRLESQLAKSMVFVTHDVRECLFLASRIALFSEGRIVFIGSPDEFLEADHPEARSFAGSLAVPRFGAGPVGGGGEGGGQGQGRRRWMSLIEYLINNRSEFVRLTLQHLVLVGISTSIAILIGVPAGIFLTRRPRFSGPILGLANLFQTIPSLALFGLLIPIPFLGGIGARTAIVALVLYALLPVIRNTFTGIKGIDPAVREAGRGMGMTDRQLLRMVEIPLAFGVILAGIRIATVVGVGVATIAAAIGAGGLGVYIFRGVATVNNTLILAGALPAAIMALTADFLLGRLERRFGRAA